MSHPDAWPIVVMPQPESSPKKAAPGGKQQPPKTVQKKLYPDADRDRDTLHDQNRGRTGRIKTPLDKPLQHSDDLFCRDCHEHRDNDNLHDQNDRRVNGSFACLTCSGAGLIYTADGEALRCHAC